LQHAVQFRLEAQASFDVVGRPTTGVRDGELIQAGHVQNGRFDMRRPAAR